MKLPVSKIPAEPSIFFMRDKPVMIDWDIAALYHVKAIRLREQVKRNAERFPADFMFQLTTTEKDELIAKCDRFHTMKHSTINPYAFTQEGVAMLSGVLKSERAVEVNVAVMRAFVRMRGILLEYRELALRLADLDRKVAGHDSAIQDIIAAIKALMPAVSRSKRVTGFASR